MSASCRQIFEPVVCLMIVASLFNVSLGAGTNAADKSAQPALGMNLSGPADWNTELPLVDVFRMSRPWISQREGAAWGQGPALDLDEHGWVKRLEAGCWAETIVCTISGGRFPAGRYAVLFEGEGRFEFGKGVSIVSDEPGRIVINVNPAETGDGVFIRLKETNPVDYIHKIKVIMPGFEEKYASNPWRPGFLDCWKGIACLRFMDWMETNGSRIATWTDRPRPDDATYSAKGIALEAMIDLCNRLQCDAWFCMPHLADDDYIHNFATLVKENLDPNLHVYLEYSNEVWNSIFEQNKYAQRKARELSIGPAERPWEGGGMYYARRSVEIFRIWKDVFGASDRFVRVLAWQAGNTWWMENIVLPFEDAHMEADALAIAPYIGMMVPENGDGLTAFQVAAWNVDQVLDHLEQQALPKSIKAIRDSKAVAEKFGLSLIAYEGGQHAVGTAGGENNEAMNELFYAANSHPRMGEIYRQYYDVWAGAGGGLFCYFASTSRWSKWGSWGILQYYNDDPEAAPKFTATMDWAERCGQKVGMKRAPGSTR